MDLAGFTREQKQAVLDLLIIGMYADRNLSLAEDERIQRVLDSFAFASEYERQQFSDAAIARASRWANSPGAMREYVGSLSHKFPTADVRRSAYETLDELITSDNLTSSEESQLLSVTREVFQL